MTRRYIYSRIDHSQFNEALAALGLTGRGFSRLTGADDRKVDRWLRGEEDIPVWVASIIAALTVPGALERLRAYIDTVVERQGPLP